MNTQQKRDAVREMLSDAYKMLSAARYLGAAGWVDDPATEAVSAALDAANRAEVEVLKEY